jgi:hypothetical protein
MKPQLKISPKNDIINKINETIMSDAESFSDVIEILIDGLQTLGVKLSFTTYPNQFSYLVSNSHNAPKGYPKNWSGDSDLPKGYPGVTGRWAGTVKLINNSYFGRIPSFSDLTSLFPFIETGTGGVGCNFSVSGMMFVYDFPRIKQLFEQDIDKQVKLLTGTYCNKIIDIGKKHEKLRREYIRSNENMCKVEKTLSTLKQLTSDLTKTKLEMQTQLANKFNEENKLRLDKAPSHFIKYDPRHELICANSSTHSDEGMVVLANQVNTIKKEMDELISNFPENFI